VLTRGKAFATSGRETRVDERKGSRHDSARKLFPKCALHASVTEENSVEMPSTI
jgi:hypothetical protein